ncbi:MAG: hypothetical protein II907_00795 [Firmicutes bacterium]|nr:hypothetical protein [Bacillota bacterium]
MTAKKETATQQCKETIFLQYNGKEVCIDQVREAIKDNYDAVKKGSDPAEEIKIYLKPEDTKAYYVVNEDFAGEVDLSFE